MVDWVDADSAAVLSAAAPPFRARDQEVVREHKDACEGYEERREKESEVQGESPHEAVMSYGNRKHNEQNKL